MARVLRPRRLLVAALGAAALLLGSVAPAVAGTPPGKSKVAWIEDPDGPYGAVMTQNGDGTGLRELLPGPGYGSVQWAPGGQRLVVERVDGSIAIYTADGTFVRAVGWRAGPRRAGRRTAGASRTPAAWPSTACRRSAGCRDG